MVIILAVAAKLSKTLVILLPLFVDSPPSSSDFSDITLSVLSLLISMIFLKDFESFDFGSAAILVKSILS
jgi:hypothetical protein